MAAEKFVTIDNESELAEFLREAARGPVIALLDGKRYRISAERDSRRPIVDPEKALDAFDQAFGVLKNDPEYVSGAMVSEIQRFRDLDV